jgi:hypothetical protein
MFEEYIRHACIKFVIFIVVVVSFVVVDDDVVVIVFVVVLYLPFTKVLKSLGLFKIAKFFTIKY